MYIAKNQTQWRINTNESPINLMNIILFPLKNIIFIRFIIVLHQFLALITLCIYLYICFLGNCFLFISLIFFYNWQRENCRTSDEITRKKIVPISYIGLNVMCLHEWFKCFCFRKMLEIMPWNLYFKYDVNWQMLEEKKIFYSGLYHRFVRTHVFQCINE